MIHHSAVSLDYLDELLREGKSAGIAEGLVGQMPLDRQREQVRRWRARGYAYAPACDNVKPDGRCAGHEKEGARGNS